LKAYQFSTIYLVPKILLILIILTGIVHSVIFSSDDSSNMISVLEDSEFQNKHIFSQFRITGYLPMYRMDTFDPNQLQYLSDVIFFAVASDSYGNIIRQIPSQYIKQIDKWKSNYPVRFHLGVIDHFGMDQTRGLSRVVRSQERRKRFAQSLRETVMELGFAGADIDWEWPTGYERSLYSELLKDVELEFDQYNLELSIAMSPFQTLDKEAFDHIDYAHLMLYDTLDYHSTLAEMELAITYLLRRGIPAEKLSAGVPFYGRGLRSYGKQWRQVISYRSLVERNMIDNYDDITAGYYFNNATTIVNKTRYAMDQQLGGMMIWELGQDAAGSNSLLQRMHKTIDNHLEYSIFRGSSITQASKKNFLVYLERTEVILIADSRQLPSLESFNEEQFQSPAIRKRRFRYALNRYV
jgi:chitinase